MHLKHHRFPAKKTSDYPCSKFERKRATVVGQLQRSERHGRETVDVEIQRLIAAQGETKEVPCLINATRINAVGFKDHFCLVDDGYFALTDALARQSNIINRTTLFRLSLNRVLAYIQNLQNTSIN